MYEIESYVDFKLWTDSDNSEFVANVYPELFSLYDNYNANIKRIDMVRYLYLDNIGGIWWILWFDKGIYCCNCSKKGFTQIFKCLDGIAT